MTPLLRQVTAAVGAAVLISLAVALCLATVPAAWGWKPRVVLSGSMEPAISPGDVVLIAKTDPGQLRRGDVVLADRPGKPGETYLHRVAQIKNGQVLTRGDANPSNDQQSVEVDAVHGRAQLVVPLVGWPLLWIADPSPLRSAVAVAVSLALLLALMAVRPLWARPAGRRRSGQSARRTRSE